MQIVDYMGWSSCSGNPCPRKILCFGNFGLSVKNWGPTELPHGVASSFFLINYSPWRITHSAEPVMLGCPEASISLSYCKSEQCFQAHWYVWLRTHNNEKKCSYAVVERHLCLSVIISAIPGSSSMEETQQLASGSRGGLNLLPCFNRAAKL